MRKIFLLLSFLFVIGGVVVAGNLDLQDGGDRNKSSRLNIYPNPIQTIGILTFTITEPTEVRIDFYDVTGQLVKTLSKEFNEKGSHTIELNTSEMKSGVYFCKISGFNWVEARRIIINH